MADGEKRRSGAQARAANNGAEAAGSTNNDGARGSSKDGEKQRRSISQARARGNSGEAASSSEPPSKRQCTLKAERDTLVNFASRVSETARAMPPDVHLVASDGSRHPAHRFVLCNWSPFFLKMFSSGMREQAQGIASFPDVEAERLSAVLSWMYGGEATVGLGKPGEVLALLELAKRWEVTELCDQLSGSDACAVDEATVVEMWDAASQLCLPELERRCRDFVMLRVAKRQAGASEELPALLKELGPDKFRSLLESDDLPVVTEEEAFDLAAKYISGSAPGQLSGEEADSILLAIRWRLVPGTAIASKAMRHPAVLDHAKPPRVRQALLPALADGMQSHLLGAEAREMPSPPSGSKAGALRTQHQIPISDFSLLAVGMQVRVVADPSALRRLCQRSAPGARHKVDWVAGMRALAGAKCSVKGLVADACAAEVDGVPGPSENDWWILPYDALYLA